MTTRLGVYWSVMHRRPQDYDYFQRLQPTVLKIMDGGPNDYAWVRANLPNTLVLARDWALSEQHDDMRRDPTATGKRHAQEWSQHAGRLGFDRAQTLVLGINEPRVWETEMRDALTPYTVAFLDECGRLGLRGGAMQLSVGWPANSGSGTPPDWNPYAPIYDAIRRGSHVLVCHEYWADQGPGEMWGWWGGRSLKCPWDVPIVIGECGVDMYVKDALQSHNQRGWQGRMDAERYARELADYVGRMSADETFVGCCVFATDFANREWASFDTEPAREQIIAAAPQKKDSTVYVPIAPKPTAPEPTVAQLVWPARGVITQRFGERPEYYLPAYGSQGHNGLDIGNSAGTPILSVADGITAYTGVDSDYGNYVRIWHEALRLHSFYAHLSEIRTDAGQAVTAGQTIGKMGSTGNSTGPHLHWEIRLAAGMHVYGQAAWGHTKGRVDPETVWAMLGEHHA